MRQGTHRRETYRSVTVLQRLGEPLRDQRGCCQVPFSRSRVQAGIEIALVYEESAAADSILGLGILKCNCKLLLRQAHICKQAAADEYRAMQVWRYLAVRVKTGDATR